MRVEPSFDDVVAPPRRSAPSGRGARHIVDHHPAALLTVDQPLDRRPWLEGVAVLAGLLIAVALVGVVQLAGPDLPDLTPADPPAAAPAEFGGGGASAPLPRGRIGQALRDGAVEFTVTGVQPGPRSPAGSSLLIALLVRNLGSSPLTVPPANQTLTDDSGRSYTAQPTADATTGDSLAAGDGVTQVLAFTLPANAKAEQLHLDSGLGGGGVIVALR